MDELENKALERILQDVKYDPKFNFRDRAFMALALFNETVTAKDYADMMDRWSKTFGG